jgi:hypothetical protein
MKYLVTLQNWFTTIEADSPEEAKKKALEDFKDVGADESHLAEMSVEVDS